MWIRRSQVDFEKDKTVVEVVLEVAKPGQYKVKADIRETTNTYFFLEKVEDGPS